MIVDILNNSKKYNSIHPLFEKAFNYLIETDFSTLQEGKHPIDGTKCFALINKYSTKQACNSFAESHQRYIDIQYMYSGEEMIGYSNIKNLKSQVYNSDIDLQKHDGELDFFTLKKNYFAIFFPEDVHMPGIIKKISQNVIKIVIKVEK